MSKSFRKSCFTCGKAEYEWPNANGTPRFKPEHPVTKVEGDHDVFGDGSVVLLSTPGHTPGHQSLLVRLPKTGAVVLSGDARHFQSNWDNRRVPAINSSKEDTAASMQRIADLLAKEHAQRWINHESRRATRRRNRPISMNRRSGFCEAVDQSVAASSDRGLTKRSSLPELGCKRDQSSDAKSMTTSARGRQLFV